MASKARHSTTWEQLQAITQQGFQPPWVESGERRQPPESRREKSVRLITKFGYPKFPLLKTPEEMADLLELERKARRSKEARKKLKRFVEKKAQEASAKLKRFVGLTRASDSGPRWYDSQHDVLRRRQIALKNPRMSAKNLCKVFDDQRIALVDTWEQKLNDTTWVEAYKNPKLRPRIQRIISTDRAQK